ncbi:hypothetical protein [Sphingomonas alba]|uniref:Uncharacterized protein n=1 Tax=Sphingomonas alba TaxID=2908208 RepID=A0ABT0RQ38_9SPHN|nr:hypothetical protein [Sphingomonas alba]MCL6684577.1 hypothetical protein [Sphingomonas alba]
MAAVDTLKTWVVRTPLTGRLAALSAIAALTSATAVRATVDGIVTGCEFTPYLPFVLLSAIFLRWWQAALIALLSVPILGLSFIGAPGKLLHSDCFQSSAAIFLAASAAMIGLVMIVRGLFHALHRPGEDESEGGVVFSLEDGEVWASWYGQGQPVLLGSEDKVSTMMHDFLAQLEVGRRLNGGK